MILDSKVYGANMGPILADKTQVGPMLAPWILLSGMEQGPLFHSLPLE